MMGSHDIRLGSRRRPLGWMVDILADTGDELELAIHELGKECSETSWCEVLQGENKLDMLEEQFLTVSGGHCVWRTVGRAW